MLHFLLIVNKQGQPRLVQPFTNHKSISNVKEQQTIIRQCISRSDKQCCVFQYNGIKLVYKKYAALYFIIGLDDKQNELGALEFIHNFVETLDQYFSKVNEVDIMYNIARVHMILNEMVQNGDIVESNRTKILAPLYVMDQSLEKT